VIGNAQEENKEASQSFITLFHYTRAKNIPLILSPNSGLRPSLIVNGDAQWGDGQYFTDLRPEESSTVTRHQH
jgi:hypothetical protein